MVRIGVGQRQHGHRGRLKLLASCRYSAGELEGDGPPCEFGPPPHGSRGPRVTDEGTAQRPSNAPRGRFENPVELRSQRSALGFEMAGEMLCPG